MSQYSYELEIKSQVEARLNAVEFIKITNELWYNSSVELVFFRNQVLDKNVSEILNLHHYAGDFVEKNISIDQTIEVTKGIAKLNFPPSRLDIGKITNEFINQDVSLEKFLTSIYNESIKNDSIEPKDVVLYGFGRIGRLLARELTARNGRGSQLRLRAIVTRGKINEDVLLKRASLLTKDSVHADFKGAVQVDVENTALILNGTTVHMISAVAPENIDYTQYGINDALIIDNTGAFRDKEALSRHLEANGASKVLLTAPGKGVPNIVYGVNHEELDVDGTDIFSAASCTTNAITPILKVITDEYGLDFGHLETIHAYTNDQNLVDNMHKKYRRGRAAALNMVITETGAGKAVSKALPELEGKLSSNAIRVPVPNGSLAILNLNLKKTTSLEDFNAKMKQYALSGDLVEQIKYSSDSELVSSDIVGCSAASIYDSQATIVSNDGKNAIVYIWYDNEYGYSHQVIRLAKHIAKVRRFSYY